MQTIEVSDEQYAYIEQLRTALQEQLVGRYGTCLDRDAIQFLIDNIDDDLDLGDAFDDAELPDGNELHFSEASVLDAGASGDGPDDDDSTDEPSADSGSEDDGSANAPTAEDADDDEMLDEMMNLLETHDDKWDESPSGDYRYRVDLPDGGTEDVQTKDDVRAILFKEYR